MSDMGNRVVQAGFSGAVGGAGTEAFETARFFISRGIEVHMIPTWESPDPVRRKEVEDLGVTVHCIKPAATGDLLRELGCPPVVSFCNPGFLTHYRRFKDHSPTVWVNCMTCVSGEERAAWKKHGLPSAFVFQSVFQRQILENRLSRHQYRPELGHLIHGAFCWDTWDYAPLAREPGDQFVVGRAARPDPAKWSSNTFEALDPVPNIQAICLGADERVRRQLGRRKWAQLLAPGAMPARELYPRLDAMICYNSTAKENWPRVGLEAMATGVPLVVDGHWGWPEMVRHGETGFLARRTSEFTEYLRLLEADEALRHRIAQQARRSLEQELASPDVIWSGWQGIWRDIGAGHLADVTGPSPLQPSIEAVQYLLAMQRETARIYEARAVPHQAIMEPPSQEFIAGENLEANRPVCWQDGKVFGYPMKLNTEIEPIPEGSVQLARPGGSRELRCNAETLPTDVRRSIEYAVRQIAIDTKNPSHKPLVIHVLPEDAHKLTEDVQEQSFSTPETTELQSQESKPA